MSFNLFFFNFILAIVGTFFETPQGSLNNRDS